MSIVFSVQEEVIEGQDHELVKFSFFYSPTPEIVFNAKGILKDKNLFVEIDHATVHGFSRQAFISILEYADEILNCTHVIVYFPSQCLEKVHLLRMFMFMGFRMIPAGHELTNGIPNNADNIFMIYKIEY